MTTTNRVMLVDGMALLFRAFYATAMSNYYMINSKGIPTNGVYGMMKHLFTAIETYQPTHVICCWDMGSKTFRNDLFPDYKANRGAPPEELIPQFDLAKEVVESLGIPNVGQAGYEADDCMGTLSREYSEHSQVFLLTGDQDLLQLLKPNVHVVLLKKGYGNYAEYHEESFTEEKGITPQQMIDLKALMGDTSDNYPGVKGIGEKTALKLLLKYETIEGILENIEELTKGQRSKIQENLDMLHLSRKLAAIHCKADVNCSLEEALFYINDEKMRAKFDELEFKNWEKNIVRM
ncbi:5'-3' exonuclease [Halobacillus karajensis]|uniref:5'-3' exonuclease n=1 Tax=Halobacillus karajensis TaxID=195088 RepID=A0A024P4T3_9BACI|nr:5'-3' exonuclease H3TH domain-containing protein [Halobacillus karajensis]CDQ18662.1 5'-3' exonuclease [Halobacillus karajensis]CDQ23266.1 5'-3' exonuclease [Halobacillus karajensis]CDQ26748.1 5'-3' exonuclease [Halobacillus karajensis]SEH48473.1 5'-3' exonuclease [Halobacillus karajensis]